MSDESDDDEPEPQSGPFCRHWGDPSDCEEVCAKCGDLCCKHDYEGPCRVDDCKCEGWEETP